MVGFILAIFSLSGSILSSSLIAELIPIRAAQRVANRVKVIMTSSISISMKRNQTRGEEEEEEEEEEK